MKVQALSKEERDILAILRSGEPLREIPPPMRGRLALYNLITETTQGWIITEAGREALVKAPEAPAKPVVRSNDLDRLISAPRARKDRKNPFDR